MAKKFGFFNSINGDRKYLASDISQAFDIGVTTGIKAEENNLKVVVYEGMQVQIQPGSAMIFGHFFMNDEPEIIYIDTADAELNRIDRVVVRYDAYTREVNTAVIKGSPALSPTPPARLETGEQFDLVLADIYVPAAATEINTSNITDMRDSELCGYIGVKGAVTKFEFETHLAESVQQFNQINSKLQYFQPPTAVPYDSGDNAWKNTSGIHFYYIGTDGIVRGYPAESAMLVHMRVPGGSLVFQQCWGSSGNLWYRRVSGSISMADAEWVKIG